MTTDKWLILAAPSLGRLERIDLGILDLGFLCDMGGKVAIAIFPLDRRIRTCCAIPPGRKLWSAATSIAFLHGRVTTPAIKRTTFFGHKDALQALLYACTNHRNHPLSNWCHLMILPIRSKTRDFYQAILGLSTRFWTPLAVYISQDLNIYVKFL